MAAQRRDDFDDDSEVDSSSTGVDSSVDLLMDVVNVERRLGRWIRALDRHVTGACRADERLKPLLKLDISSGVAEDRFMAQLSQHFEAAEVGLLARCLCVPLVSIRVGIVNKDGNLLRPTSTRGQLNLALLPSSSLRISFTSDDGLVENLAVLINDTERSQVNIDEISADKSGRSFLLKLPGHDVFYFWCSEKSEMHGKRLLSKMKDLLRRKPSLSQLTGICQSRLDSFSIHLRAYLLGSSNASEACLSSSTETLKTASSMHAAEADAQSRSDVPNSQSYQFNRTSLAKSEASKQTGPSPRHNIVTFGNASEISCITSGFGEKVKRLEDTNHSSLLSESKMASASTLISQPTDQNGGTVCTSRFSSSAFISQPETPSPSSGHHSSVPQLLNLPPLSIGASKSLLSPYYCWCPPGPSSFQYSLSTHQPISFDESLQLPPVSSLLQVPATGPTEMLIASSLSRNGLETSSLSLPSLLPEPFSHHSLPLSPLITMPSSKQASTSAPYMSDPIVHIPVFDVCSSGQGYLVNAGSSMPSAIPPSLPNLINDTESPVEKSARETLRILMASTPSFTNPSLINTMPTVFNRISEDLPRLLVGKHVMASAGEECERLPTGMFFEAVKLCVPSPRVDVNDSNDPEDSACTLVSNSEMYNHEEDALSDSIS